MDQMLLRKISLIRFSHRSLTSYPRIPSSLHIVMIGKTGNGKSSTGNTILGRACFKKSLSFMSCTNTAEYSEVEVEGHMLKIMDTPGLFDTRSGKSMLGKESYMSNESILLEIAKTALNFPSGVHVFLLVFSCSNRFTKEEEETLKAIEKRFGKSFYDHCLLIFTRSAEFIDADVTLGELLYDNQFLLDLMHKVRGRAIAVENFDKSGEFDYQAFIRHAIFEVVHRNEGIVYSGELFEKARKEFETEAIRQESLSEIRKMPLKLISNLLIGNGANEYPIDDISKENIISAIKAHNFVCVTDKDIKHIVNKYFEENAIDIESMKKMGEKEKMKKLQQQAERQTCSEDLRKLVTSIIEAEMNAYITNKSKTELCSIVSTISMGNVPEDMLRIVFNRLPAEMRPKLGKNDESFNEMILEILNEKQSLMVNIIGNTSQIFGFLVGDLWGPLLSSTRLAIKNWFPFK